MIKQEPTTSEEWRSYCYKLEADPLMFAAQAYDKEGDTVKADAAWTLWEAKKAEIRAKHA